MTFAEFDNFQALLIADVINMKRTKGLEYANSENRFANFDRLAADLGLSSEEVAWVYVAKHLDSIKQAIRTKQYTGRAESLRGRFVDVLTYMSLIAGIIEEKLQNEGPAIKEQDANSGKQQPFEYDPNTFSSRD